jgi:hypothetical protein
MEFVGLGAEMAQLAGRFGSVDSPAAARADLEWSFGGGARGSPPTDRDDEDLRLFDPTAA